LFGDASGHGKSAAQLMMLHEQSVDQEEIAGADSPAGNTNPPLDSGGPYRSRSAQHPLDGPSDSV
jgi:hypothetical protein